MSDPHTIQLQRVLRAPPERIYRAFITPSALCKWLPPHGFSGEVQTLDARVGGRYHMSFHKLSTAAAHGFGGEYLELVPGERLRYSARFDDPQLPGEMQTTVLLLPVFCGTELRITQQGIPAVIPPQACLLGWQESLALLALLVEPEFPAD